MRKETMIALVQSLTIIELSEFERIVATEVAMRFHPTDPTPEEIALWHQPGTPERPHPKIEAIKAFRARAGVGLREAKQMLENTWPPKIEAST